MGNEKDFSRRVRESLRLAGCACYPVETGGTSVGFPDLVVVHKGGASFVELKCRPKALLSGIASSSLEGPGQKAFARRLASLSAFMAGACVASSRSFLLAECMDGYALMAEERGGPWLAACWEGFPDGNDLDDALRAWRVGVSPSPSLEGRSMGFCYGECAKEYLALTGIAISLAGIAREDEAFGGKEAALAMERDICDRGRLALSMGRMDCNAHGKEG